MKKTISLVLSAVLLLCSVIGAQLEVFAATQYEYESNNSYNSANSITPGNSIQGVISSSSDVDYFRITAPDNGKLSISFLHTYADMSDDWDVYVYYFTGGEYKELSYYSIDLNENEKISFPFIGTVTGGVYYIRVSRCCNGIVGKTYTLSTAFTASNYYEKEMNNVYSTATNCAVNKTYKGTINFGGDKDYYRFKAPSRGKLSLSFLHTYADTSDDWDVYVYYYTDGEYKELSYYSIDLNENENINIPYIGTVKDGVYYVVVSRCCNGVIGKEYTIKSSFTESNGYEKELNNVYSTATSVSVNSSISGVLNSGSDKDCYKIKAPVSGPLKITFKHTYKDMYDDWDVYVYRYYDGEYSQLVYESIDLNQKSSITLPAIGAKKGGTYFVVVSRCCNGVIGQNYTLSISLKFNALKNFSVSAGKKKFTAKWSKASGASGYEVQYATNSKFTKGKKTVNVSKSSGSKTVKSLGSKKTYYVRVRYYKTVSGKKYYSNWTSGKKVKTK